MYELVKPVLIRRTYFNTILYVPGTSNKNITIPFLFTDYDRLLNPIYFFSFFFFSPSQLFSSPSCSSSLPLVTQIRGHRAGTVPSLTTVHAFIFMARIVQVFLPSSTRVASCIQTLLGAISDSVFCARKVLTQST